MQTEWDVVDGDSLFMSEADSLPFAISAVLCCLTAVQNSFFGAQSRSNNVVEVQGMTVALLWAKHHLLAAAQRLGHPIFIEFDSDYATKSIERLWRGKQNLAEILLGRAALDSVRSQVVFRHVMAHQGDYRNERADYLARAGANGISSGRSELVQLIRPQL